MAKKNDYPENRSLLARMEAIMRANGLMYNMLSRMADAVPTMPEPIPGMLKQQYEEAMEAGRMARRAISGEDDE